MVDHTSLPDALLGWARDELAEALPDTRCQFTASICAHPTVPPPHLAVLVYIAVPSLAQLGRNIGLAVVMALGEVTEDTVRRAVRDTAEQVTAAAHQELAAANGAGHPEARIFQWPPQ